MKKVNVLISSLLAACIFISGFCSAYGDTGETTSSAHKHSYDVQIKYELDEDSLCTVTTETGTCSCGRGYRIVTKAACAGYLRGTGSSTLSMVTVKMGDDPNERNAENYDSTDCDASFSVVKQRTNTESLGTHTGKYTISDENIAEYYGGKEHEYRYEVRKLVQAKIESTKYAYIGKGISPAYHIVDFTAPPYPKDELGEMQPVKNADYETLIDGKKDSMMTAVGTYEFIIKPLGNEFCIYNNVFNGYKTNLKVVPKKASIGITTGKGKVTVKFSTPVSSTGGDKYQIRYRKVGTETWKTVKTERQIKAVRNLTKGKKYEIQARAIKTIDGTSYYGSWSTVKTSIKVK